MATFCGKCTTGPMGIVGHDGLQVETIGGGVMGFRCSQCGARWLRALKIDAPGELKWDGPGIASSRRLRIRGVSLPRGSSVA